MKEKRFIRMMTLAFVLLLSATESGLAKSGFCQTSISCQLKEIDGAHSEIVRENQTRDLARSIRRLGTTALSENDIEGIGALLRDNDDMVRLWAANALGAVGPRAQREVPALIYALKEAKQEYKRLPAGPDVSSEPSICIALKKITGAIQSECHRFSSAIEHDERQSSASP